MVRGNVERHPVSRFVREIPRDMLDNGLPESGSGVRMRAPSSVLPEMRKAMQAEAPKKYDNPYIRKENVSAPAKQKPFAGLSYKVGDKVSHVKYGIGTVKEIREGKRDYEVTVDFQTWGVKRLLAAFANLTPAE
jgi:DNA helicase-2/ATP-dependent DNA helicase PcrA